MIFSDCFQKWLAKSNLPDKDENASLNISSMESTKEDQGGTGGRPVAMEGKKINNLIIDKWLDPSPTAEEPTWTMALYDTAAAWQP